MTGPFLYAGIESLPFRRGFFIPAASQSFAQRETSPSGRGGFGEAEDGEG